MAAGLVLSFMSGISHTYYTIALTPAIGALAGIGATRLWQARHTWFARATLAATRLVTGAWAWVLLGRSAGWFPWLRVVIVLGAAGLILAGPMLRAGTTRGRAILAAIPVSLALIAGLGGPLAYSIDTAVTSHSGASPSAGPTVRQGLRRQHQRQRRPHQADRDGRAWLETGEAAAQPRTCPVAASAATWRCSGRRAASKVSQAGAAFSKLAWPVSSPAW